MAYCRKQSKIEKCAGYHGLGFNKTKCISMNFNATGKTKYEDGTPVPTDETVTYLGADISKTNDVKKEVSRKISRTFKSYRFIISFQFEVNIKSIREGYILLVYILRIWNFTKAFYVSLDPKLIVLKP